MENNEGKPYPQANAKYTAWSNVSNTAVQLAAGLEGHKIYVTRLSVAELAGAAEVLQIFSGTNQKDTKNIAATNTTVFSDVSETSPIVLNDGEALKVVCASAANVDVSVTYEYR